MKMNHLVGSLTLYDMVGTEGVACDLSHMNTKASVKARTREAAPPAAAPPGAEEGCAQRVLFQRLLILTRAIRRASRARRTCMRR